jgi:hypothetical protein
LPQEDPAQQFFGDRVDYFRRTSRFRVGTLESSDSCRHAHLLEQLNGVVETMKKVKKTTRERQSNQTKTIMRITLCSAFGNQHFGAAVKSIGIIASVSCQRRVT